MTVGGSGVRERVSFLRSKRDFDAISMGVFLTDSVCVIESVLLFLLILCIIIWVAPWIRIQRDSSSSFSHVFCWLRLLNRIIMRWQICWTWPHLRIAIKPNCFGFYLIKFVWAEFGINFFNIGLSSNF